MTKEEDFKLLKIQTCVLKVNIHCDGCKQKVKKLLQRIEGVYQVNIDAEQQKVTVSGSVDSAILIKKLFKAGKHAELWSQKGSQTQKQKNNNKDEKGNKGQNQSLNLIKGLEAFKNQQKYPVFSSEDDDDCFDDEEDDDDEEDELRLIRERANQLGLLRQPAAVLNNAKKGAPGIAAVPNNGNGNAAKKGIPSQNMGMKVNPAGLDQKTMAALKMSNAHLGGGNFNPLEGRRVNDINSMMGLAGFHGNSAAAAAAAAAAAPAALGANSNGMGGFQVKPNNGYEGSSAAAAAFPNGGYGSGQYPSSTLMNMNGYGHGHPSPMMMNMNMNMNLQNRHAAMQQPQMMYQRSPYIPPTTGYYYHHSPPTYSYCEPSYSEGDKAGATHMVSDENTGGCSIM